MSKYAGCVAKLIALPRRPEVTLRLITEGKVARECIQIYVHVDLNKEFVRNIQSNESYMASVKS